MAVAPLTTTRLRRAEIRENELLLMALVDRLREGGPLGVRGLAIAACLVTTARGRCRQSRSSRQLPETRFSMPGAGNGGATSTDEQEEWDG